MKLVKYDIAWTRSFYMLLGVILILTLGLGNATNIVQAQSTDNWSDPTNISQSGAASNPVLFQDLDGVFHVVWMDEFANLVYASGDGTEWSSPAPIFLPSGDVIPFLIADLNGYIHAFWRDINNRLFYSRVWAAAFSNSTSWSSRVVISESALDFDVALDENGDLHLSYVNPLESEGFPAGVYYHRLWDGTSTWLPPSLLYESPYFRSLELANSNVDVSTSADGESTRIFVVWDNLPRERIYLARSDDNGVSWSSPEEIDQPRTGNVGSGPSNILVSANGDEVMLIWRVGDQDSSCNQYYRVSQNKGETWSFRQPIFGNTSFCLEDTQIVEGGEHPILMGKADQIYFLTWDGNRWSDPQPQEPLTRFIDADTQNPVELGCRQFILNESNSLYVIGCDEGLGKDIWLLRRQMQDIDNWFPVESGWSKLEDVDSFDAKITSPKIKNDERDRAHLFWSRVDEQNPGNLGKSIFYSLRQNERWSPSNEILSSPLGKAEQIDVAINSENQLLVVWSGGLRGEIFFSHADSSQAFDAASWSEPISLPAPLPVGSSPNILIEPNNNIHVVYAIPLNEQRGVYITNSVDSGQTWSNPNLVFDAQDAGWDMVDNPYLAMTLNGHLHVVWTRYSLPSGEGPLELYYARSEDGGVSWSTPQLVMEGSVVWSQIIGTGENTVQRVWQQDSSSGSTLWHEQSVDSGTTWERIAPVSIFGEIVGSPSLSSDKAGRLHLLLVVRSGIDSYILQHWVYDGQSWAAESSNSIQFSPDAEIGSISSDLSSNGLLTVAFLNTTSGVNGVDQYQLVYTNYAVEVPDVNITSTPSPDITPTPVTTATSIPTIQSIESVQPQITNTAAAINFPLQANNSGNPGWIAIAGPAVIGLIALVVIFIIVLRVRR